MEGRGPSKADELREVETLIELQHALDAAIENLARIDERLARLSPKARAAALTTSDAFDLYSTARVVIEARNAYRHAIRRAHPRATRETL